MDKYHIIHEDDHCIIIKSNGPREYYLGEPLKLVEELWVIKESEDTEFRSNMRTSRYGKRVFYVYNMSQQICEFKAIDLSEGESRWPENQHPLLIDDGVVMTPLRDIHEILEYVLFDALVGKNDSDM